MEKGVTLVSHIFRPFKAWPQHFPFCRECERALIWICNTHYFAVGGKWHIRSLWVELFKTSRVSL